MFLSKVKQNFTDEIGEKSACMLFGNFAIAKPYKEICESKNQVCGVSPPHFPAVMHYKYLGSILSCDCSSQRHIDYFSSKINFITYTLGAIRRKDVNFKFVYSCFETFVVPLLMYAASACSNNKYNKDK